jgi:hypothetical protein
MKNRKMVLSIVLIVSVAFFACAQQYDAESDFEVSPQDGGKSVVITKYLGSKWEVRIPPRIQGLPVTHIGGGMLGGAFSRKNLISVTIPNSVTNIGDYAFSANQLTSVTIPNGVTHIGQGAFNYNKQLISVTISNTVTSVGVEAFGDCDSLTTINVGTSNSAYTSENGVLYNKDKTFLHTYPKGKTAVSFTIPNNVTSIEDYAFKNCTNLTDLIIPNSVTSIGNYAFIGCTGTGRFFEAIHSLVAIMSDYESIPAQERRDRYDDILKTTLKSQTNFVRIFSIWKPNAIDGMDIRYIGRPGSTATGQYAMTYGRDTGEIIAMPNLNIEETMAYINGPDARRERVKPMSFKVNGQDVWILRIEVPIINPRTNEVVGNVGCYYRY